MDKVVTATLVSLIGLVGIPVAAVASYSRLGPVLGVNMALYGLLTVVVSLSLTCLIFLVTMVTYLSSLPAVST